MDSTRGNAHRVLALALALALCAGHKLGGRLCTERGACYSGWTPPIAAPFRALTAARGALEDGIPYPTRDPLHCAASVRPFSGTRLSFFFLSCPFFDPHDAHMGLSMSLLGKVVCMTRLHPCSRPRLSLNSLLYPRHNPSIDTRRAHRQSARRPDALCLFFTFRRPPLAREPLRARELARLSLVAPHGSPR